MKSALALLPIVALVAACSSEAPPSETPTAAAESAASDGAIASGDSASAVVRAADGTEMGTATATVTNGAVQIAFIGNSLPAGVHGAHVHTVGKCEGPFFESAGSHWNPAAAKHGTMGGAGHAGDLANLTVAADGIGTLDQRTPSGTFAEMLDADGASFVIHADPDDLRTDPSGNSGARIACGVFERG